MSMILSKTVTGWVVAWDIDGMVQFVAFPTAHEAQMRFPSVKAEDWLCTVCEEYKTSMHGNPDSGFCADCYDAYQKDEDDNYRIDYDDQFPANL